MTRIIKFISRMRNRSYTRAIFLNFPKRPSRFPFFFPHEEDALGKTVKKKDDGEARRKREDGQNKVLQRTRSRRRFMDSARSHLKDYIEQTITNQSFFFSLGSIPCPTLYNIAFPATPSLYPVCLPKTEGGKFELLFDDDASPSRRGAALFYGHLVM